MFSQLRMVGARACIALFVALSVILSAAFAGLTISPPGKHCVTAPVQKVQFLIAVQDTAGKLVLTPIDRAPKPGELAFKQCHCEDKKASKDAKEVATNVAFVWFVPSIPTLIQMKPLERLHCEASLPSMVSLATHPPIPPPDEA